MRGALLQTQKRRVAVLVLSLCLISLFSVCSTWRIWSYADLCLYRRLRYHSVVAQWLWRGNPTRGPNRSGHRDVAPNFTRAAGPFLRIDYYPTGDLSPGNLSLEGTSLLAKDGRLIAAGSYGCTFQRAYFDVSTADENALYERLLEERIKAKAVDMR